MEIAAIKHHLSIQTVLDHYGLKPDRHDMIKCPFHDDHNPSLKIYPKTNTFHCFGCDKNGDAIEFCSLKEGDKHKGILKAGELSGLPTEPQPVKKNASQKKTNSNNHSRILTSVFTIFKHGLHAAVAKRPRAYLESRGLDPTRLEVGYNSGQFHHRGKLPEDDRQACIDAGLLIPYHGTVPKVQGISYTPFAKDCIIFPLKDKQTRIVGIYGRSIQEDKKAAGSPQAGKHFYLKNRSGLYPSYPLPETTRLILTEAIIDAASLLQIPEVTEHYGILACYGTNGLTAEHQAAIKSLTNLEEIIFFFDGDKAGKDAVKKYHQLFNKELPQVKTSVVKTPKSEDVNSLLAGHSPEIFTYLLDKRELLFLTEASLSESADKPKQDQSPPATAADKPGQLNTNNPDFITYTTDELQMIILGGVNLGQLDRLRVTLKISRRDTGNPLHSIRHTIDLYHSDYLEKFLAKASEQLEVGSNTLRRSLAGLTDQIETYRLKRIESMKEQKPVERQLTEQRYKKAVNYLKASRLMERTGQDIGRSGMIGEENNRLLMYLVFTSRLREQPLHIISLGSSGTGKTYLQEKIAGLIPENQKMEITILSENAFYYFDRKELRNKLVLIEDMDGAEHVLYPLRELQTKRRISKTIPIKDSKGNLKTITLQVEGPICLAGTTTKERLYEDNANRSLLIYLDGSHEHREQIMEYQRKLSAGKINAQAEHDQKEFFKDMQSVLKPIAVRNPFAEYLKLPEHVFKPLRTNAHYLAVIETITFYHQYQREIKTDPQTGERYIQTTVEDIRWANKLLKDVLLAKSDELPRVVRQFFEKLKGWLQKEKKENFYAREIRDRLRMYPMKVNRYLHELESRGLIRKSGGNRKTGFEYEVWRWNDYRQLQAGADLMDKLLEQLPSITEA